MMRITASLEYEGIPFSNTELRAHLLDFHSEHPFATGMDWQHQYFYADLQDKDAFAFILKHPQYASRFKNV